MFRLSIMIGIILTYSPYGFAAELSNPSIPKPRYFISSIEEHLIELIENMAIHHRYSMYKLGGEYFDTLRGIYVVDCSNYINHLLQLMYPDAYTSLINSTGSEKPTSKHYFDFFKKLSNDDDVNEDATKYWDTITNVKQLQPGDILVFRVKNRHGATGHVMMVMHKPTLHDNAYWVRVSDSAPIGHSNDTRPKHTSGIGIGTLLLKANPKTGEPIAYAWDIGSYWKRNVKIAMARPIDQSEDV